MSIILLADSISAQVGKRSDRKLLGPFRQFALDLKRARKIVLGKRLVDLAERMRTEEVTDRLVGTRLGAGWTWFEWDGAIEGRHAPEASQVHAERVGALVHANADGLTGSMHFAWRSVDPSSSEHAVEIEVIATSFDLRDAPEPVASIWSPITEHEHRAAMAKIARMSPAEEATSPERAIAFANRFGAIPSPYFENVLEHVRQRDPLRHQFKSNWLENSVNNIQHEIGLVLYLARCLNMCSNIERSEVLPQQRTFAQKRIYGPRTLCYTFADLRPDPVSQTPPF